MDSAHNVVPVLTGVIYGAIVVVWAAYLVPLALRRHDEASRTRSIEKFSSGDADPGQAAERRDRWFVRRQVVVVTPERGQPRMITPDPGPEPERVLVAPRPDRAAERVAAARRRRVLSVLVALTVVVGLGALLGLLPLWSVALPLVLVAGFLGVAHRAVRRAAEPHWVEAPASEQSSSVVVRRRRTTGCRPSSYERDPGDDGARP